MGKRKCSVQDCQSEENRPEDIGVSFHKYPHNAEVRAKWMEVCKVVDVGQKVLFVCSRHFLRADFGAYKGKKYVLRNGVMPTIFPWSKRQPKKSQNGKKTKRNRKGSKPEHVTDDVKCISDKEDVTSEEEKSALKQEEENNDTEDVVESEDSTSESRDLPPVLEPEDLQLPKVGSEIDKIPECPELEPSTGAFLLEDEEKSNKLEKSISAEKKTKVKRSLDKSPLATDKSTTIKEKTNAEEIITTPKEKISTIKEKLTTTNEKDSIIKSKIIVEEKCKPSEIKSLRTKGEKPEQKTKTNSELSNVIESHSPEMLMQSEIKQEISVSPNRSTTIEQKIQTVNTATGQLTFEPNTRIEALDFNQTWSPATIMEVDYEENEVLVHFDSYSNKYDEWIGINSSSIRAPSSGVEEAVKEEVEVKEEPYDGVTYEIGERCYAYWIDAKKFPVTVKEILNQETYVVEFDDGYIKTLNASKMIKFSKKKACKTMHNSPLFLPIKSSKEERRKRKRKLNVQALFKKRIKMKSQSLDSSLVDEPSSADETPLNKSDGLGFYESDLWYPDFENGCPVGKHRKLKTKIGLKNTIVVPDPRIPADWEKHFFQRDTGKYCCLIVTSDGKRLRSRADIQRYIHENPTFNLEHYTLDFNIAPRRTRNLVPEPVLRDKTHPKEKPLDQDQTVSPPPEPQLKILQVDGGFQCPIEGCGKNFRRENLVQMHVKHYHPEFKKYLESTPNVLDLVYQRLHGDNFELSPGRTYDYSKRSSYIPEDIPNANDTSLFEQQKDAEIKKLLSVSPYDAATTETGSPAPIACNSFADIKLRDLLNTGESVDSPDLKSLVVTTKKGLKTIPAVRKENRETEELMEVEVVSNGNVNRKRKIDDIVTDDLDGSGSGVIGTDHDFALLPPPILDHIISEDGKVIKIEHMRKEEIINCTCGITEEDGLMIQCEICMCWQHAHCNNIYREIDVPEKYICYICQHPLRQRNSKKYMHDQDWLKHGILPTGSYHCKDEEANQKRFDQLKASHDISGGLIELKDYMHSLKLKINIAELKNHPKLYLWSKQWENGSLPEKRHSLKHDDLAEENKQDTTNLLIPKEEKKDDLVELQKLDLNALFEKNLQETTMNIPQPEAAIETADCRLNLLEHIVHCQSLIEQRLADYEKRIDELDSNQNIDDDKDENRVRLTTSMLVRDLGTLKELSQFATF